MGLLYDISVLGLGQRDLRARTGVFRVVENVALELVRQPSLGLRFSALAAPAPSRQYVQEHASFSKVPVTVSAARSALDSAVDWLSGRIEKTPGSAARLPLRTARAAATRLLGRWPSIDRHELAGVRIFHSPYFPLPEETRRAPGLIRFLTIYDLIPILRPDLFEGAGEHLVTRAIASLTPDDWVLCISEATRQDLLDHRPDLKPEQVRVTRLGAAAHFRPDRQDERWPQLRQKYGLPDEPYALTLSTLEPRKNIALAIRSYARLALEGQIGEMRLVLVGTRGWKMDSIYAELDRLGPLRERVIVTGFVPDEDLAPIYSRALMFLYPSLYEGFGLPPLEAMQCGVPVVASNSSSLPEVVGDAGILVPATDGDQLCQAILNLFRDENLRARLSARALARAKEFSWARCGAETVAAYAKAVGGPP